MADWLAGLLDRWLVGRLAARLPGRVAGWLARWLADWIGALHLKSVSGLRETTLSYKNDALVHAEHHFEKEAKLLKTVCAEQIGISCRQNTHFFCKSRPCLDSKFDKCTLAQAKAVHLLESAVSPRQNHHF